MLPVPVLYSPNKPVYFLGFFTSWIRIRICPSRRHIFMRIRIRNTDCNEKLTERVIYVRIRSINLVYVCHQTMLSTVPVFRIISDAESQPHGAADFRTTLEPEPFLLLLFQNYRTLLRSELEP